MKRRNEGGQFFLRKYIPNCRLRDSAKRHHLNCQPAN
jgi:hypothetical protein